MALAATIATLPLLHLIFREERSHRTGVPEAPVVSRSADYWTRPGPVRTERASERIAA